MPLRAFVAGFLMTINLAKPGTKKALAFLSSLYQADPVRLVGKIFDLDATIVFPSLVLNYAGQAAIVLADGVTTDNIFYQLCPTPLLMPMIVLATVATVIAVNPSSPGRFP